MFTGIIQSIAPIVNINKENGLCTHVIKSSDDFIYKLYTGASISYNGCCLTVTSINNNFIILQLIQETIKITNLGKLKIGDFINLERAANFNTEIGGHIMSGHIICTANIKKVLFLRNHKKIWFRMLNKEFTKYLLYKDYIGIDGVSLTLGKIIKNCFCVHLIPATLTRTTLGKKCINDVVNIEVNINTQAIIDTSERILTRI